MSVGGGKDKPNVVCPHEEGMKQRQVSDNRDGPPKPHAKEKPDAKGHTCMIPFIRNVQNR